MENSKYSKLSLGEIVSEDYRKSEVFNRYGLDFCCGGKKSLTEACSEKSISQDEVIVALMKMENSPLSPSQDFNSWKLDFLVDYIVNTHHVYVKTNMPVILQYTRKIADVHGANHPELLKIAKIFEGITHDLTEHLDKEEQVLFPNIKKLLNGLSVGSTVGLEPVSGLINGMETEHDFVGGEIHAIAALSANYTVPPDACSTYQVTYKKLKEFEEDIHQHVHLENNILFKKIREIEMN